MDKKYLRYIVAVAVLAIPVMVFAQSERNDSLSEETDTAAVAENVLVPPAYHGGVEALYQFLKDNIEYPEDAAKRSISGQVEVSFTIAKSGDVTSVSIIKGLDPSVDNEIKRVFKAMPLWEPATMNGKPIAYKIMMPVTVKLARNKNGNKSNLSL